MKKSIVIALAIGLVLTFGTLALAGTNPGSGIKQTPHDLSSASGKGSSWDAGVAADPTLDRICIYCHAPHHAMSAGQASSAGLSYYPLWNHAVSTKATFSMYSSGEAPNSTQHQFNGAGATRPGSISILCLSCHDGSQAISTYGFAPAGSTHVGGTPASGRILIGGGAGNFSDLSNHHPIGFDYDTVASADDEINPSSTSLLGANLSGLTIGDLLWGGKMECSTCHDVHNTKNEGTKFTWVQDSGSNLCFTCHNK